MLVRGSIILILCVIFWIYFPGNKTSRARARAKSKKSEKFALTILILPGQHRMRRKRPTVEDEIFSSITIYIENQIEK
jgi:hypothetical protein